MDPQTPGILLRPTGRAEHLETLLGILVSQVEPDGAGIALAGLDEVGSWLHVEPGLFPGQAILGDGVGRAPLGEIPHLELFVLRVVPYAVAIDHTTAEDRVFLVVCGTMMGPFQAGLGHEKVIDEKLPADIDRDDFWRGGQIRGDGRCLRDRAYARWPG